MSNLAFLGGNKVINKELPAYKSLGVAEEKAVVDVVRSGSLSGFFGSWQNGFLGGPKVREFEAAWAKRFDVRHVVSVNSNTSGLTAAMGAIGIGPGDEVIVPCTTMSATAMAPIFYGGVPVFADITEDTFCIDINSVRDNLTEKTKAVIAVNLFGHPAPLAELYKLCQEKGIYLIEDNAQAPLATENGKFCGTIGHIGVFSLNYHKHIHTGEGGMCCTDNENLAQRLQMIRNHAEAVVESAGVGDLTNMVGMNLRLTEMSAAVGFVQLNDIDEHISRRQNLAESLSKGLSGLEGITVPVVRESCRSVYYCWVLRYDSKTVGVSRKTFIDALRAEGYPCFPGYVRPLYMLPAFQRRIAIGGEGFPFSLSNREYSAGLCPVAERLHEHEIIGFETCAYEVNANNSAHLVEAFCKVHAARSELTAWEKNQS